MGTRSQRHLREIYGIDSGGNSDGPTVTMIDAVGAGPLGGANWVISVVGGGAPNPSSIAGGIIELDGFAQIENITVVGLEVGSSYVVDLSSVPIGPTVAISVRLSGAGVATVPLGAQSAVVGPIGAAQPIHSLYITNTTNAGNTTINISAGITITKV